MLYVVQDRGGAPALSFVAMRPDCRAGTLECTGKAPAAFLDDPILIVRELVPDNLRNHDVNDTLTAQRFERTEQGLVRVIAREVKPDACIEKQAHGSYRVATAFYFSIFHHFSLPVPPPIDTKLSAVCRSASLIGLRP